MEEGYSEGDIQALEEVRRKSAEKVRWLLAQLETAEREFASATEKVVALRFRRRRGDG